MATKNISMKNYAVILIVILFSFSCKGKQNLKYPDIDEYLDKRIKMEVEVIEKYKGVKNGDELTVMINIISKKKYHMAVTALKLKRKYPHLNRSSIGNIPELKKKYEELEKLKERSMESQKIILKYIDSPEVKKAIYNQNQLFKDIYGK